MSDYTPTTEQVREEYIDGRYDPGFSDRLYEEGGAEFDRWLEAHDREVEERVLTIVAEGFRLAAEHGYNVAENQRVYKMLMIQAKLGG